MIARVIRVTLVGTGIFPCWSTLSESTQVPIPMSEQLESKSDRKYHNTITAHYQPLSTALCPALPTGAGRSTA